MNTASVEKIYPHKGKLVKSIIGSALFTLAGGILIYSEQQLTGVARVLVYLAYIGAPLFAWLFLHSLFQLFFKRPLIVLSDDGILERSSAFGVGLVKWSEIKHIGITRAGRQQFLGVMVKQPEQLLERLGGVKRMMAKMNMQVGHAPIKIMENMLELPLTELESKMKSFWKS